MGRKQEITSHIEEVYEFKKEYYMNDPIIHHGKYKGFDIYTFRDYDDDLCGVCPVLSIFSIDDGSLKDDEDLVVKDLKGAVDLTIEAAKRYSNGEIWSTELDKTVYV